MSKQPYLRFLGFVVLLAATFAAAQPPPGAPRAEAPIFVPAGSSWVYSVRESGSFGSASEQRVTIARGEQTWQGRKVHAYEEKDVTTLREFPTWKFVARIRGTALLERMDPPAFGWNWPMWVGKSWTEDIHYTVYDIHQRGRPSDFEGYWKVVAYEEIKVPAGTFKAFLIRFVERSTEFLHWWSPDLGIVVKSWEKRLIINSAGPGTRDRELVSYEIKK